jgi:hypothetical protein
MNVTRVLHCLGCGRPCGVTEEAYRDVNGGRREVACFACAKSYADAYLHAALRRTRNHRRIA